MARGFEQTDGFPDINSAELFAIIDHREPRILPPLDFDESTIPDVDVTLAEMGLDALRTPFMRTLDDQDFSYDPNDRPLSARDVGLRRIPANATVVEGEDGKPKIIFAVDPKSNSSMIRTQGTLTRLLVRNVSDQAVNNPLPDGVEPMQRPEPSDYHGQSRTPVESARILMGNAPDEPLLNMENVVSGTRTAVAASVVAGVLMTGTPKIPNTSISGRTPIAAEVKVQTQEYKTPTPEAKPTKRIIDNQTVEVSYIASRPTHLRAVAIDLGVSQKLLALANPHLDPKAEIPAGTKIGGIIKATPLEITEPITVGNAARAFGLTDDAIRSTNEVNEEGMITDNLVVPRQLIRLDEGVRPNIGALTEAFKLSEVQARNVYYANFHAPAGVLVLPNNSNLVDQTPQVDQIVAAAHVDAEQRANLDIPQDSLADPIVIPSPDLEPQVPVTMVPKTTTIVAPDITSTSTTAPETTTTAVPDTAPSTVSPETTQATTAAPETTITSAPVTTAPETTTTAVPDTAPTTTAPAAPAPEMVPVERPATSAEKLEADRKAIAQAVEYADQTGDLGPLNHLVAYSPIFEPFDLPAELQTGNIRKMPPANFLGVPGINYEFHLQSGDKQRLNQVMIISLQIAASYKYDKLVHSDPRFSHLVNSCLRWGDGIALEGHASHDGDEFDATSVMDCKIIDGHGSADGPVFWINHQEGGINRSVSNPNYNKELDTIMLDFLLRASIDGKAILKNILYNAPGLPPINVVLFENHQHHIHGNGNNNGHRRKLKEWGVGGDRPEVNLDKMALQVLSGYDRGMGVPGTSLDLKITTFETAPAGLPPISGAIIEAVPAPETSAVAPAPEVAAPTPEIPAPAPEAPAPDLKATQDFLSNILPSSAGIPPEIASKITGSRHFTAIQLAAQMKNESNFNPNAASGVGALGLGQFMEAAWHEMAARYPELTNPNASRTDVNESILRQRLYMDDMYDLVIKYMNEGRIKGDPTELTYAAYNAGMGNVKKYGGVPPFKETRNYIKRITDTRQQYEDKVVQEYLGQ